MIKDDTSTIDYESCVAYYRAGGRIDKAAAIERYLGSHPEMAERAARDADHELALAHRFDPVLDETIPARLHHHPTPPKQIWLARAGFAATIGLSISAGWWLHGLESNPHQQATAPATFGQQVAHLAHTTTSQSFQSVSGDTQNGVDSHHPDLSEAGYTFSGQRKIATDNHPMTAFVYRNGNGKRVTIYTRSYRTTDAAMPDVISPAGIALAHWRSHGADYALTGNLPPASLRELARTATGQMESQAQRRQQPASTVDPDQPKTQQAQVPNHMSRHPVDQQPTRQQATSGL